MSCLKCLKYTMCVVNLIFFICGAAIFGCGVYLMINFRVSLLSSLPSMSIANVLFITGIIITCVSFLGFLGALKENRCLLISFFSLMFILMVAELIAACFLLMYESKIDGYIADDLQTSIKNSKEKRQNKDRNSTVHDDWDFVQMTFKCCGVKNYTDWNNPIPSTCCMDESMPCPHNNTQNTNLWPQGCYDKLKDMFESNLLNTGIGVIVVCIIEVLGMCFSMTLFCHISRSGLQYKY